MATAATVVPTLDDKIDFAAQEAARVASLFAPKAAEAISAGAAAEPIIRGLVQMFVHLFSHHAKAQTK